VAGASTVGLVAAAGPAGRRHPGGQDSPIGP